jgi:hypothetical protein
MFKYLRLILQVIGLVKKYEPAVKEVVKDAKPIVKDLLDKQKSKK